MRSDVLGVLAAAAAIGVLLGLRYRAPAVLLVSMVVAVAGAVLALLMDASALGALALSWGAVAALQCGYLGGLLIGCAATRIRTRRGGEPML